MPRPWRVAAAWAMAFACGWMAGYGLWGAAIGSLLTLAALSGLLFAKVALDLRGDLRDVLVSEMQRLRGRWPRSPRRLLGIRVRPVADSNRDKNGHQQ